jgi:hypothetical protein
VGRLLLSFLNDTFDGDRVWRAEQLSIVELVLLVEPLEKLLLFLLFGVG